MTKKTVGYFTLTATAIIVKVYQGQSGRNIILWAITEGNIEKILQCVHTFDSKP